MTNDEVCQEISRCVTVSAPGPHAIIFVTRIGRFTEEERKTIQVLVILTFDLIKLLLIFYTYLKHKTTIFYLSCLLIKAENTRIVFPKLFQVADLSFFTTKNVLLWDQTDNLNHFFDPTQKNGELLRETLY